MNYYNVFFCFLVILYNENFESPNLFKFVYIFKLIFTFSFFIIFINFWSLIPYVYGLTTNLVVGLSFALSYWICLNISNMVNNMNSFFGHFVSPGAPLGLGFILSYVDVVSSVVRPFTLTLRLVINVSIGHVIFSLLGLMGSNFIFSSFFFMGLILLFLMMFYFIEFFVSIIQSLVFGLLGVNYLGEHS
uniref:ATP synthase subunit a n=1 Tax=Vorticeros sp. n. MW-2019 TaxID=2544881 RepID=A0AA50AF39_9PLAT|nr:ATP synthase F0 subunit 6 [Vorticeros sp. n. MW-2019]